MLEAEPPRPDPLAAHDSDFENGAGPDLDADGAAKGTEAQTGLKQTVA